MKIEKLRIRNIASIEDAEIDFTTAPLADAPLFLICGETGAGKSTILDAISLALFADTPRMDSASREKYNSEGDRELSVSNPLQLLRRGAGEGFAEVTFAACDGERYRASWSARRSRRKPGGKLQDAERSLTRLGDNRQWTKKEVPSELASILGFSFQQFCRVTLLAQGEFTRFLKSGEREKAEILERLTDTSIYSRIGARIFANASEMKSKIELAEEAVKTAREGLLTDEQIEESNMRLDELVKSRELVSADAERHRAAGDWLKKFRETHRLHQRSLEDLQRADAGLQSATYKESDTTLREYDISQPARESLAEIARLRKAAAQAAKQESFHKEQLELAQEMAKDLEQKIAGLKKHREATASELGKYNPGALEKERENLILIEKRGASARAGMHSLSGYASTLADMRTAIDEASTRLQEAQERIDAAKPQLAASIEALEAARARRDKVNLSLSDMVRDIRSRLQEGDECPVCGHRIGRILSDERFRSALQPLEDEVKRIEKVVNSLEVEIKTGKNLAKVAESDRKKRTGDLEKAGRDLRKLLVAVGSDLEALGIACDLKQLDPEELKCAAARAGTQGKKAAEALGKVTADLKEVSRLNAEDAADAASLLKLTGSLSAVAERISSHSTLQKRGSEDARQAEEQIVEAQRDVRGFIARSGISGGRLDELCGLSAEQVASMRGSCEKIRNAAAAARGAAENAERSLADVIGQRPLHAWPGVEAEELGGTFGEEAAKDNEAAIREGLEQVKQLATAEGQCRETLAADARLRESINGNLTRLATQKREAEPWMRLNALFGDREGKKFRGIAQSYILEHLLKRANVHLRHFTDRYLFTCQRGSLSILVDDRSMPGHPRSVSVLSGGESFMASLALALALSGLTQGGIGPDMLLIDEGFGTLSPDCLDSVMETLGRLGDSGGRSVGVISHVAELRDRIPTRIVVSRRNPTSSEIRIEQG